MINTVPVINNWRNLPQLNYMTTTERGVLLTMLDAIQPKRMIEFGVNDGNTARTVLNHIDSIEYYLGVDVPFDHIMTLSVQQSEAPREPGRFVKDDPRFDLFLRFNGVSEQVILDDEQFDVAFIDGDHSYRGVMLDYGISRQVVRLGGLILFHDYNNPAVEVTSALADIQTQEKDRKLFHVAGTWIVYEQL